MGGGGRERHVSPHCKFSTDPREALGMLKSIQETAPLGPVGWVWGGGQLGCIRTVLLGVDDHINPGTGTASAIYKEQGLHLLVYCDHIGRGLGHILFMNTPF